MNKISSVILIRLWRRRIPGFFASLRMTSYMSLCLFLFMSTSLMADKTVDKIVAIVNQDVITLYDLDRAMAPMLAEIRKAPNFDAAYSEAKQKTLEQLIDDALLKQEIDKAKIEVDENELARAIAGVLAQNRITIDMLRSELASKGISFESYKKQLADQIRRMKFIQQNVSAALHISEEEIDSFLKEQQKES